MPHNWYKPFPRDAVHIVHPETGEIVLSRTSDQIGTPLPDGTWNLIEQIRREWVEFDRARTLERQGHTAVEEKKLRQRIMVRESRVETAAEVRKILSGWIDYVDTPRWQQLLTWLEKHPQRWNESDTLLHLASDQLKHFDDTSVDQDKKPNVQGRKPGFTVSEEHAKRISESMKKRWQEYRTTGTVPKVGRPRDQGIIKKDSPY